MFYDRFIDLWAMENLDRTRSGILEVEYILQDELRVENVPHFADCKAHRVGMISHNISERSLSGLFS